MTRFVAASALVLALTLPAVARADEASERAKAEELISLQRTEKSVEQVADNITKQVDDAADRIAGPDATADQKAKVDGFKKQAEQMIGAQLGWAAMKPAVVDLYVKTFTEEQLSAILAFYKSPAGEAMLEKLPEVNSQFGQIGSTRVADLRVQLQKSYQDLQNSLHPVPTLGAPSSPATPAPAAGTSAPGATHPGGK